MATREMGRALSISTSKRIELFAFFAIRTRKEDDKNAMTSRECSCRSIPFCCSSFFSFLFRLNDVTVPPLSLSLSLSRRDWFCSLTIWAKQNVPLGLGLALFIYSFLSFYATRALRRISFAWFARPHMDRKLPATMAARASANFSSNKFTATAVYQLLAIRCWWKNKKKEKKKRKKEIAYRYAHYSSEWR